MWTFALLFFGRFIDFLTFANKSVFVYFSLFFGQFS